MCIGRLEHFQISNLQYNSRLIWHLEYSNTSSQQISPRNAYVEKSCFLSYLYLLLLWFFSIFFFSSTVYIDNRYQFFEWMTECCTEKVTSKDKSLILKSDKNMIQWNIGENVLKNVKHKYGTIQYNTIQYNTIRYGTPC